MVERVGGLEGFPRRYLGAVPTCLGRAGYRVGWSGRACGALLTWLFGWQRQAGGVGALPWAMHLARCSGNGYRVGDPGRDWIVGGRGL